MMPTRIQTKRGGRVCQGDIFKNVEFIEYAIETSGQVEISKILFPHVVVLTQDCDLSQDYKVRWSRKETKDQDKKIFSVIVAPLYNSEHVFNGEHLDQLEMKMQTISKKTPGQKILINENPRYHFLAFPEGIPLVPSIIDFKHYFTVNVEYLKRIRKQNFVCKIAPLYREDLSQRFASFLARIGLPDQISSSAPKAT